jgi:hypothetical protein
MTVNIREKLRKMKPEERKRVEDRAAGLIAEEMKLREALNTPKPPRKRSKSRS